MTLEIENARLLCYMRAEQGYWQAEVERLNAWAEKQRQGAEDHRTSAKMAEQLEIEYRHRAIDAQRNVLEISRHIERIS